MQQYDLFHRAPEASFRRKSDGTRKQPSIPYIALLEKNTQRLAGIISDIALVQAREKQSREVMRAALEVPVDCTELNIKTLEN